MIVTTTPEIAGKRIVEYKDIVFGEVVDFAEMGFSRSSLANSFETKLTNAKRRVLTKLVDTASQLGANAIVGISFNFIYEGALIGVSVTGTAVVVE